DAGHGRGDGGAGPRVGRARAVSGLVDLDGDRLAAQQRDRDGLQLGRGRENGSAEARRERPGGHESDQQLAPSHEKWCSPPATRSGPTAPLVRRDPTKGDRSGVQDATCMFLVVQTATDCRPGTQDGASPGGALTETSAGAGSYLKTRRPLSTGSSIRVTRSLHPGVRVEGYGLGRPRAAGRLRG